MSMQITVVGLGSGDMGRISLDAWQVLSQAKTIYVRTTDHPAVQQFIHHHISYISFDDYYQKYNRFEEVYAAIVDTLICHAKSSQEQIVYAVPGHPMVAESTVQQLIQKCKHEKIKLDIKSSESFLDQAWLSFGFDPIDGFQILDATHMNRYAINPSLHTIISQVYDTFTASDVKLMLMEIYPDDYQVWVGHKLGVTNQEKIVQLPLYELDRDKEFGNQSVIWVPSSSDQTLFKRNFHRLHEIVKLLRSPNGCPWDQEQTHLTLRKHLLEESYEVIEAIEEDAPDHLCEELGDLLLQVLLHAQIEEEAGMFDVFDVMATLHDKLIRRHPHVFGDVHVSDANDVAKNWEQIKKQEQEQKGKNAAHLSILDGIPKSMPNLLKAWKLQKKAAKVGFDWQTADQVIAKVREELEEFEFEVELKNQDALERQKEELGDLLFATINLARFLEIDPDEALSMTNRKFIQRFTYIEESLQNQGKSFDDVDFSYLDHLWNESKKR